MNSKNINRLIRMQHVQRMDERRIDGQGKETRVVEREGHLN